MIARGPSRIRSQGDVRRGLVLALQGQLGLWIGAAIFAGMLVFGYGPGAPLGLRIAVLLALSLLLIAQLAGYMHKTRALNHDRVNLQLGLVLILSANLLLESFPGQRAMLFPINYLLVALLASFNRTRLGLLFCALILMLDWRWAWRHPEEMLTWVPVYHSAITLLFGVLVGGFFKLEYQRRKRAEDEVSLAVQNTEQLHRAGQQAGRQGAGSEAIVSLSRKGERMLSDDIRRQYDEKIARLLDRVRRLTGSSACLLYQVSAGRDRLLLAASALQGDLEPIRSLPIQTGFFAPILNFKQSFSTNKVEGEKPLAVPYYKGHPEIYSFLGVPQKEQLDGKEEVTAILLVDSRETNAYPAEKSYQTFLEFVLGQIRAERENAGLLLRVEREKSETQAFLNLSRQLNATLMLDEVAQLVTSNSHQIVPFDAAVLSLRDEKSKSFSIISAWAPEQGRWSRIAQFERESFGEADGVLASMTMRRLRDGADDHPVRIPNWSDRDNPDALFSPDLSITGVESVLSIPLIRQGRSRKHLIGLLTLLSERRGMFSEHEEKIFRILGNQIATAITNARNYEEQLKKATTDGLTGLYNHRHFQEWLERTLAATKRFPEPIGIILCDIDHFKKVNDTYGHPAGDEVLRKVSGILRANLREHDMAARYGGEEFCMVLRNASVKATRQYAERLRKTVEKMVVDLEDGQKLKVTMSFGVAAFPDEATEKAQLIECADQALYAAKHGGRNRVMLYGELASQLAKKAAS